MLIDKPVLSDENEKLVNTNDLIIGSTFLLVIASVIFIFINYIISIGILGFILLLQFTIGRLHRKKYKVFLQSDEGIKHLEYINRSAEIRREEKQLAKIEYAKYQKVHGDKFAVNEQDQKIKLDKVIYDWNVLLGAEIIRDGQSIQTTNLSGGSKTKRSPSLTKAVVGGVVFGPVGAVVGGVGGGKSKTKSNESTTTIDEMYYTYKLRIDINSVSNPCIYINCPNDEICQKCYMIIQNIINQNNQKLEEVAE